MSITRSRKQQEDPKKFTRRPLTVAPRKFIDWAKEEIQKDPNVQCFRAYGDKVIPVDPEEASEVPGDYILSRQNDRGENEVIVNTSLSEESIDLRRAAGGADGTLARGANMAVIGAMDTQRSQIILLQKELADERRARRTSEERYDEIKEQNHALKDQIRDLTLKQQDGASEVVMMVAQLVNNGFNAWQNNRFRDQFIQRLNVIFPDLDEKSRKIVLDKIVNNPAFNNAGLLNDSNVPH